MRAVAGAVLEWTAEGRRFALATVVQTRGSSPRPTGACMAVRDDGLSVGSVSGGCVEGAVITEALSVLGDGRPRLLEFGEASDDGWEVGLSCGGGIQVWVERPALEEDGPDGTGWWDVLRMADEGLACVRVASLDPNRPTHLVWSPTGASSGGLLPAVEAARSAWGRREDGVAEVEGVPCFVHVMPAPDRLLIVGAVHIAVPLVRLARDLGFTSVVVDPRAAFATAERFPDPPDLLVAEWPQDALCGFPPDEETYAILLTHDPKIDDPALEILLRSPAPYIGALGGRSTQASRRERMRAKGFSEEDLDRIRGPVGLAIGARTPEEIALAILAEIVQVKRMR
ncbi:MAG: XdhC family protein [Fimbriimonadaceae bacterium]|nr:XdhC family protein [Chthonomonadaceae bacterium]MCO5296789.1 XdhC family protein [Fimbriimonadaceae bacterium]